MRLPFGAGGRRTARPSAGFPAAIWTWATTSDRLTCRFTCGNVSSGHSRYENAGDVVHELREGVDELLLRHRRAARDPGLLRAVVELVAAERGEVVSVGGCAVPFALRLRQAALERGHEVGDR